MSDAQKISQQLDIHDISDLQLKCFWVLDHLMTAGGERFSATQVAKYLIEICGVSTSRQAVTHALDKDRKACHKSKDGYKLMELGRRQLTELISNRVIIIEANKPFSTKRIVLKDIFAGMSGPILICDPYVDIHTLDVLFHNVDKHAQVKILTQNIVGNPTGAFERHLEHLRREQFQIEVKKYSNSELHDRYIMDATTFWLSGNSLNYIGTKESFLVRLGNDIKDSMTAVFNRRWSAAVAS